MREKAAVFSTASGWSFWASVRSGEGLRYKLRFTDGLDNDFYNQPLTLIFTFEGERSVERVRFVPPLGALGEFDVVNKRMQLDAVPDERRYVMHVE